jgi:DNA-binding NtrC family response regulator
MDEDIPVNKNIRILVVCEMVGDADNSVTGALESMGLQNIVVINGSGDAIKLYAQDYKNNPYDVVLIQDLENNEELDLLKGIIEVDEHQYVVMLTQSISADNVLNSIKFGASGVLSKPFTTDKLKVELEKYSLLREDPRSSSS